MSDRRSAVPNPQARFGLAAMLLLATPALAEDTAVSGDDSANDTILVTGARARQVTSGTKTDTPLIRTPQAITIVDQQELIDRNVLSVNQAVTYVAGVSPDQRGAMATRYDQFLLRGFQPPVFLDGMRVLAGPYSAPQTDFNRIDHIDIVKGPASVLYGNSTPGGIVNIASKLPEATASGTVEGQAGNYDFKRFVADVNQPLDREGKLLFRGVAGWQKTDLLTRYTRSERWHVSPMLTFAPDARTSLTIIGVYQRSPSGGGYAGVPAYGSILPNPLGRIPRDFNAGDPNYERYRHTNKSISTLFRHDFDDRFSVRSNMRYADNRLSYRQMYTAGFATTGTGTGRNTDYGTITRGGGGADEHFRTLTLDNGLTAKVATGPLRHTVLAGIDYQTIKGVAVQQFNSGTTGNPLTSVPNLSLFDPVYGGALPSSDLRLLSTAYSDTRSTRDQVGVYLQDQIALEKLQLIASGRYDWYDQTSVNRRNLTPTQLRQKAFTGRVGALYAFDFGVSPYASFATSFEPQTGTTYLGQPFDPVTGRQVEAGVKYQPRGLNALFTVAAYDLRRRKVVVGDPLAGTNGIPATSQVQIGETRVRGVEFEGRGEVLPGLDLIATASYTDAQITQGAPASGITPTTTGTRQLGTPAWTANGFATYDFGKSRRQAGAIGGLKLGGGARYVSGSDGITTYLVRNGASVFQRFSTRNYAVVDALASYDLGFAFPALRGVTLAVNANNLFDKRYVATCPFTNSCYYGAARTVIGSLRFHW